MPWIDVPQASGAVRASMARARAAVGEARPWYSIRNASSADEAELLLYDEIGGWFGNTAEQFVADLKTVTAPKLRVRISSPGGSVFEGLAIANALRAHDAETTVQVDGIAASIASVIAMAGDRVVMAPNSMLMIHEASDVCYGDAAEMTKTAEVLDLVSDNIADAYAAKAGGTRESWRAAMRLESWYLPEDAVKAGLADEALPTGAPEPAEDEPTARTDWDLAAYGYRGPKVPEKPKPGPPPVKATAPAEEPAPVSLTISLGDAVGDQVLEALRKSVATPATVPAEPVGTGPDGAAAGTDALPPEASVPAAPKPEAKTDPEWAGIFAHLTTPKPDAWAAAFSHLTAQPASSATES